MLLKKWEDLPENMQCPEVRRYYDKLAKHRLGIFCKRIFDFSVALILLIVLAIPMIVIAVLIVLDSPGGVLYRQVRVTTYGKEFRIHKFRTMVANADKIGTQVTVGNDVRITKTGKFLRRYRLDEMPQLFDVLQGDMSIIGTRPPLISETNLYELHHRARLAIKPGITGMWQVSGRSDITDFEEVVRLDKEYITNWNIGLDIKILFKTILVVFRKDGSM